MHKTPSRGIGHCGVSIGVYGQEDGIIRGANADERVWSKAQRSCIMLRHHKTAPLLPPSLPPSITEPNKQINPLEHLW